VTIRLVARDHTAGSSPARKAIHYAWRLCRGCTRGCSSASQFCAQLSERPREFLSSRFADLTTKILPSVRLSRCLTPEVLLLNARSLREAVVHPMVDVAQLEAPGSKHGPVRRRICPCSEGAERGALAPGNRVPDYL
jgi:hypothetical protein